MSFQQNIPLRLYQTLTCAVAIMEVAIFGTLEGIKVLKIKMSNENSNWLDIKGQSALYCQRNAVATDDRCRRHADDRQTLQQVVAVTHLSYKF